LVLKQLELLPFLTFGKAKYPYLVNISVENEQESPPQLMYRAPNRVNHQNITEIFDEILNRLDAIEKTLTDLEFQD